MTRRKKTRSLADKIQIRTGRRKDYRQWRHNNPELVHSSRRFIQKKQQQRKLQALQKKKRHETSRQLELHPANPSSNTIL